jgi:hypothetical protein
MEWNYFFSSLAQSAAALIGIIGAFIISKIIDENNNYVETKIEFYDIIESGRLLEVKASNYDFEKYKNMLCKEDIKEETKRMQYKYEKIKVKCESHKAAQKSLKKDIIQVMKEFAHLKTILICLMVGVFVFIIYPLSFLPYPKTETWTLSIKASSVLGSLLSYQGVILFVLLVLVEAIFFYFFNQLSNLSKEYDCLLKKFKGKYEDLKYWESLIIEPVSMHKIESLSDE